MVQLLSRISTIKTAQKESVLLRLISQLVHEATLEHPAFAGLYVSRVQLSPGKSNCTVFFYTVQGADHFSALLDDLKLYKPSIRKAIATRVNARYTVDLLFKFDEQFERTQRIEQLLEKVKDEVVSNS